MLGIWWMKGRGGHTQVFNRRPATVIVLALLLDDPVDDITIRNVDDS